MFLLFVQPKPSLIVNLTFTYTSTSLCKERCTKKGHTSAKKLLSDTQAQTRGSIAHVVRHTSAKQDPQSKAVQNIGHTSTKKLLSDTQVQSRSHKAKIGKDIRHRSTGQRCTAFDMN